MAEKHEKSASALLRWHGKNSDQQPVSIELFQSEQWRGGKPGTYRVKIDKKWRNGEGKAREYLPMLRVGRMIAERLAEVVGGILYERKPSFTHPARLSVPNNAPDATMPTTGAWTIAPPHQGPDGRWFVWVKTFEGPELVPVADVTVASVKKRTK